MVIAVIWSIVLIALAAALWIRKPLTRVLVPLLLLVYAIYRLALVGIFAESAYARESQVATAVLYGVAIAFTSWALNRKAVRGYFEKGKVDQDLDSRPSQKIS
jgi:ascorbate-specific PTS system EIIC-type component UlaA